MSQNTTPLSATEIETLEALDRAGGLLISRVSDKNETDVVFGTVTAGMTVYKKLIKRGLALITEEDLIDEEDPDMGTWTPMLQVTPEGEAWLAEYRAGAEARAEAAHQANLTRLASKKRPK
jgi:hypothetical protein